MKTPLGFSTGCLHTCGLTLKEQLAAIAKTECPAVELNMLRAENFWSDALDTLTEDDLAPFQYVSLHTPKLEYKKDVDTLNVLRRIHCLNQSLFMGLVVFHPPQIADMDILMCPGFVAAIENMDNRTAAYTTPEEFAPVFAKNAGLLMVLDVNHVFTNDPSLELAKRFYETCGNRIAEIHLSAYTGYHEPLYKVDPPQPQIIRAIQNLDVPIVVEGVFEHPDELLRERDYILEVLGSR